MIKYIGRKYLNSNFYKNLSLIKDGDDVKVKAVIDDKFKNVLTIKTDTKVITEQIEGLTDLEKVKEIVLYFLRNNKICGLDQCSDKIVISSTSSRKLILKLDNKYKDLINIIIDKYLNDRIEFINNYCGKEVYITGENNTSSYCLDDKIMLCMMCHNGDLAAFDKNFLKEYLKSLIEGCNNYIKTNSEILKYNMYIDSIKVSISKFHIPQELLKDIYSWVFNRNCNMFENNKQYKLEGIK